MITFLYGANTYEVARAEKALLADLAKKYPGVVPERFDGANLEPASLPDLLQGMSLFDERRIVVLKAPGANKALWTALETYVGSVADTTDLIITDPAADKRTRTFKALTSHADAHEYPEFGQRNSAALMKWLADDAKRRGVDLPRDSANLLIEHAGYDQWALAGALEKLALVGDASPARIRDLVPKSPSASAFELFEYALRGDATRVQAMLTDLRTTQDPHALVGLLASQAYGLALVAHSTKAPAELGRLTGMSAYPLQKISPIASRMTRARVAATIAVLAECDRDLKRSVAPPWTLITRALLKVAAA